MTNQHDMQDPRGQFSQMNIPPQKQAEPGLDSNLKPLADHGAETYVGSGRLQDRKALITGGDSGIGRAVALAFAREGADVAINYLPSEQSDADEVIATLEPGDGKIITLPGIKPNNAFPVYHSDRPKPREKSTHPVKR